MVLYHLLPLNRFHCNFDVFLHRIHLKLRNSALDVVWKLLMQFWIINATPHLLLFVLLRITHQVKKFSFRFQIRLLEFWWDFSASQAAGYCYFNGTAIAAQHAKKRGCERILIVDWDVHFGNGTAEIFAKDKSVLYISFHRHDSAEYYPKMVEAGIENFGLPPAEGFNVNIAWNKGEKNDSDYFFAFHKLVLPLANEFRPDFVIVSAGQSC